jgi:hypothetical protein
MNWPRHGAYMVWDEKCTQNVRKTEGKKPLG